MCVCASAAAGCKTHSHWFHVARETEQAMENENWKLVNAFIWSKKEIERRAVRIMNMNAKKSNPWTHLIAAYHFFAAWCTAHHIMSQLIECDRKAVRCNASDTIAPGLLSDSILDWHKIWQKVMQNKQHTEKVQQRTHQPTTDILYIWIHMCVHDAVNMSKAI